MKNVKNLHKLIEKKLIASKIKVLKNNLSRHEFHLRAELGNNFSKILSEIIPCTIVKTEKSLSQKYPTLLIVTTKLSNGIPKGTELLLVNNGKSNNGILKTKQLSPNALGFAGKTYNAKQLYNELIKSLEKIDIRVRPVIKNLIDASNTNKLKVNIENVTSADINIIAKDYGELIGALWALKFKYKDTVSVTFPEASNAALVDYYLTKKDGGIINISAKAGQGAAPSLTAVSGVIEEGLIEVKSAEKEQKEFILDVKKTSGMDAIVKFSKKFKTPGYNEIVKCGGDIRSHQTLEKQISSMTYDEVVSQFGSVWDVMNRRPNEVNARKLFDSNGKKAGVLLSPLGYHLIDSVNSHNDYVRFLNKSLNSLATQQLYLDIGQNSIKYTVREFKDSKFKYHFDSNIKNPANKKISFKMKK